MVFQLETLIVPRRQRQREMKRRRKRKLYSKATSFIAMNLVDAGRETARRRFIC
jgi:hypothetical protein